MSILVRNETVEDLNQVREVLIQAFDNREDEALLVERIRRAPEFVPELSIIAQSSDGEIIGHLLISEALVIEGDKQHTVLVLAPLAVKPSHQKSGVGTLLMEEGLRRSHELGYAAVMLIGHPSYYPRFGFKPGRVYGLELKQYDVPDDVFMVCELNGLNGVTGELRYPESFEGV
ncbi:GNAT family N-acetyltransferase [Paenibacillus mendelii]|uniref:GNAT family N-acetyltransferase n=1 Tax=Paenibacillus mendelii TaxID=206163 RepID=A0ABV6JFY2_9BACL|nr:N-acetyltransferase [Paenibacillus mendelii]MCQ6557709.1 N-acetyltransferase [Paenibacillus mendelii]